MFTYSMIMTVIMVLYTVSAEARVTDNIVVAPFNWELPLIEVTMWIMLIHVFILPFTRFRVIPTWKLLSKWIVLYLCLTGGGLKMAHVKYAIQCYFLPVAMNVVAYWLDFIVYPLLDSQSGKGYSHSRYAKKQKNKRNAAKKRAIAAQQIEQRKQEDKRCKDNKLQSQVGRKDFYNLTFDLSDEVLDIVGRIWFFFRDIMEEFRVPSIPWELMSSLKTTLEENLPRIVDSEILKGINILLSLFVAIGWIKRIEFSLWGVCVFKTQPLHRTVTLAEVASETWKLCKKIVSCFVQFFETGKLSAFWDDTPKNAFEDMYTRIVSEWPLIDVGRIGTLEFAEFDRELDNCINHCLNEMKTCKDGERVYFSTRLLNLRKIAVGRCKQKKGTLREAPFCVLFTGGSSVGKTVIASGIGRYLAGVGGYDNTPDNCFSMNEQDKFMSGIGTHHTIIRIDDIAQVKPDKATECPIEKIILLNNNQPMPATVAEAEKKGQIMLDPRVVTATTNVDNLDAPTWVNEPEAIYRRFNVHIEQAVRPEFQEKDSARLDKVKARQFGNDMFPDYALFRPYTWIPVERGGSTKFDKLLKQSFTKKYVFGENKWLNIEELLDFLKDEALEHFEGQRAFVAGQRQNDVFEICSECKKPSQFCKCEKLDSQAGLPGICEVREWYLTMEERVCAQIDIWLAEFFNTQYGFMLMGYNFRNQLIEAVKFYVSHFICILGFITFAEFSGARFCGTFVIFAFGMIIALICLKVRQLRNQLLSRYTHCPRPSVWFSELSWETKRRILFAFGGMFMWKFLHNAARAYFASLKHVQAGERDGFNNGFEINEKPWQNNEHPWWGDIGRAIRERPYRYKVPRGHDAENTCDQHIINMMIKRQCILEKEDGEFCNIVPIESNIWLLPGHVVPKQSMKAKIRRPAGNFANVILDPASTIKVSGDLCLWYLPEMGDQKDITGYLPTAEIYDGKSIDCRMVYNDSHCVKVSDPFCATYKRVHTERGGVFKGLDYNFPINTFNGLCMGTLVGLGKKHHIAGFHLAGRGKHGGAGLLTFEQYYVAKSKLAAKPAILFSHSSMPFNTQIQDVDVGPLRAPHEKCVTRSLPLGSKVKVIGSHNQPFSTPSSKVVTSLISDSVTTIMGIRKQHGKPKEMADRRHKEADIVGKVDTVFQIDQARLDKSVVDYGIDIEKKLCEKELRQVRVISDDANLSGLDGVLGVNAINFATSRGFPHSGPKDKIVDLSDRVVDGISCVRDAPPELWAEVARMEETLAKGFRINTVYKSSLKDAPSEIDKDKVRVFAACNFATILLVRKYFLSLAALVQRNQTTFECAVGVVQQSPEWTDIYEHIGRYGWERGIAGDYAKFDARMSARFMFAAFKILIQIAEKSGNYSARDLEIMRGIATEITYPTYDYFGTLVQFFGSNPSGHPLTVIINSLVNSLYMRYAYYTIAEEDGWWRIPAFREVVSLMTYGDDNIMTVRKGYGAINHTRIAKVFECMGIKYTMADKNAESVPYIHLSSASFLKHYAVWDDELNLYRSPCEESTIAKMLHTHLKSGILSMEQSSAEAINNAALKYFEFGRDVYEERRKQLLEVVCDAGLSGYVSDLPTYDERLNWYCEKFGLAKCD